jgi:hypothetical protein
VTTTISPAGTDRPHHSAVEAHLAERVGSVQVRLADWITTFAGSMWFVYLHAVGFALWMLLVEHDPWPGDPHADPGVAPPAGRGAGRSVGTGIDRRPTVIDRSGKLSRRTWPC